MKIILIAQFYNEISSGFLHQFCKYNLSIFDSVIAYNDGSSDETAAYCKRHGIHVIGSSKNDFTSEVAHKTSLIEAADKEGADFIVSLDADEIIQMDREGLENLCNKLIQEEKDGYSANFINLWRSNCFKRTDSLFDDYKPVKLWRHKLGIEPFKNVDKGLHQRLYPDYVESCVYNENLVVIHTGFSTKEHILDKFVRYRSLGQTGFNLLRFIDESNLCLEKVDKKHLPNDWVLNELPPEPYSIREYFHYIEDARNRVFRPKITIFSLIYKDIDWLDFMYHQLLKYTPLEDVEFYFIANDADESVISYMKENYIPFYDYKNTKEHRKEHYINNVYRAYNYGVTKAKGDFVLMLNSDMAFSEGWLESLLSHCDEGTCISSRLIEQGKLRTGKYGLEKNFGDSWQHYKEEEFQAYVSSIKSNETKEGGLYMPLLIRKADFEAVGGYPEGNIVPGTDIFNPEIAKAGQPVISGDTAFIEKLASIGVKHFTAFDSVVYHFQEGEKRSENCIRFESKNAYVTAICNNSLNGINNEKVLWGHLLEQLPNTFGLDYEIVGGKTPESFSAYVTDNTFNPLTILQNATFIPRFFPEKRTLMYLQDNLRAMGSTTSQQELNLKNADCRITNTVDTAASYPEYDFDICPVGVDDILFSPMCKVDVRNKHGIKLSDKIGIFVGALDEVKGWPEVYKIIESEPDINWIVVTKYEQKLNHPRIKFYARQPQSSLVELLNCADFFILASPVETQCLAAIEAALCDIPVVIKSVGTFSSLTPQEKLSIGNVGNDLHKGVKSIFSSDREFSPRKTIISKGITLEATSELWWSVLARENMKALKESYQGISREEGRLSLFNRMVYGIELFYRFKVLKPIIKRDTFYSVAEISVFVRDNMPGPIHASMRYLWRLTRGKH